MYGYGYGTYGIPGSVRYGYIGGVSGGTRGGGSIAFTSTWVGVESTPSKRR
jgi:hypothetical protein